MPPQDNTPPDTRNTSATAPDRTEPPARPDSASRVPGPKKSHRGTVILAAVLIGAVGLSALAAGAALLAVGIGAVAVAALAIYLVWTTRRGN